ncbi:hypothetical protein D3C76_1792800 [compost metagenome]
MLFGQGQYLLTGTVGGNDGRGGQSAGPDQGFDQNAAHTAGSDKADLHEALLLAFG